MDRDRERESKRRREHEWEEVVVGLQNEGMHDREQTKTLWGASVKGIQLEEREADSEREKSMKRRKTSLQRRLSHPF